jgi:hypothetical protein
MKQKKLKPVIFVQGQKPNYSPNYFAQTILLKAIATGETDPTKLRKLAGMKTVAEVYRTLDKLAIRREYHEALARNDIDFDYIVMGIKKIAEGAKYDATKIEAFKTILKSLGLEKYEESEESHKGWEDAIIQAEEKNLLTENKQSEDYEVNIPQIPQSVQDTHKKDKEFGKSIYESTDDTKT